MGGVVDTVGGLFGVEGGESVDPLQYRPYDVRSSLGQASVDGRQVNAQLSPELQGLFSSLTGRAGQGLEQTPSVSSLMGQGGQMQQAASDLYGMAPQFQQQAQGLLGRAQNQLDIASDPQSALEYQQRVFGPELERQRLSQESRLYNQGLLGSTTGALQQQATREGQTQALLQGAQQQQQQAFQQGQGLLSQALQNQQLGMGALGQGAQQDLARQQFEASLQQQGQNQALQQLQAALGLGNAPLGLAQLGGQFGQSELQAQEGTAGLRQQAEANQANFFSGLVQGGGQLATAGAMASDARLKNHVTPIGGGWYTWEWNDEAKRIGADKYPTTGVIAQDLLETNPDAVFEGDHGYLMVDYSKVG